MARLFGRKTNRGRAAGASSLWSRAQICLRSVGESFIAPPATLSPPPSQHDDIERVGNLIEAGLWLVFALIFMGLAWRTPGRRRRGFLRLAAGFAVFAVSDVIESHTGAWWRPPWLLLLKVACVVAFYFGLREHWRVRKKQRPDA